MAQTATIILPGLPQPPIIYGEVCANGATFTMIGVCSFYPFGVVIWQDVSNMSCKDGISPLCVAKVIKKLQLSQFYSPKDKFLDKICLNYARNAK